MEIEPRPEGLRGHPNYSTVRKEVKNGFIDVVETVETVKRSNPSTHEIDNVPVKAWEFTPNMLPDGHEMPRDPFAWQQEFSKVGKKLAPLRATHHSEFKNVLAKCEVLIQEAFDAKHNPPTDAYTEELARLGFK